MIRIVAMALICAVSWCPWVAAAAGDAGTPEAWVKMLESADFGEREQAGQKLRQWAEGKVEEARDLFLDQVLDHEDPEVRMRCRELLRESVVEEFRSRGKGFVGIRMLEMQIEAGGGFGIRIVEVQADTPAAKAGLLVGDVVVGMEGKRWEVPGAMEWFRDEVMARHPGDKIILTIKRGGQADLLDVEVELALRPPDLEARLLWQNLQQNQEELRRQQEEIRFQEEKRYFDRWLAERLRLRERQRGDPPAGKR